MKNKYPISSMEINDIIYSAFEDLTYLLGYQNENGVVISGYYNQLDTSVTNTFLSGILALNDFIQDNTNFTPFSGYMDISDYLKADYLFRTHFKSEVK